MQQRDYHLVPAFTHALVGAGAKVRVIPEGERWPVKEVKSILKEG